MAKNADPDILSSLAKLAGWHTSYQLAARLGCVTDSRDDRALVSSQLKAAALDGKIQSYGKRRDRRYARLSEPAYQPDSSAVVSSEEKNAVLRVFSAQNNGLKFGAIQVASGLDKLTAKNALKALISDNALASAGVRAQTRYYLPGSVPVQSSKSLGENNVARSRAMPPPRSPAPEQKSLEVPKQVRKMRAKAEETKEPVEIATTEFTTLENITVEKAVELVIATHPRGRWFIPWTIGTVVRERYGLSGNAANARVQELLREGEGTILEKQFFDDDGHRLMVRRPFLNL